MLSAPKKPPFHDPVTFTGGPLYGADVLLDAQICANSAVVRQASSVRGAHLDTSDKLFVGLYYLRHPDDASTGGELQLYGPRARRLPWVGAFDSKDRFGLSETVPYEHNVLVLFLNSIHSVHLVTPRSPTPYPRLLVNLIGAVKDPIWQHQRSLADRLQQRLLWKAGTTMNWTADAAR